MARDKSCCAVATHTVSVIGGHRTLGRDTESAIGGCRVLGRDMVGGDRILGRDTVSVIACVGMVTVVGDSHCQERVEDVSDPAPHMKSAADAALADVFEAIGALSHRFVKKD